MSRIRSLKPGFFKNEDLAGLSAWHRLCFAGLWTEADKAGRMEDRPKRLKAAIFPYDDLDMEQLLRDLAATGFILRYVVEETPYLAIRNWDKHQHPRLDEPGSTCPTPVTATETDTSLSSHGPVAAQITPQVTAKRMGYGVRDLGSGVRGTDQNQDQDHRLRRNLSRPLTIASFQVTCTVIAHLFEHPPPNGAASWTEMALSEIAEHVKQACADADMGYDNAVIHKALDAQLTRLRQGARAAPPAAFTDIQTLVKNLAQR